MIVILLDVSPTMDVASSLYMAVYEGGASYSHGQQDEATDEW